MRKEKLLDIILDLPANLREQLAEEIYQGLDAADPDLNAGWIVEANQRMQQLEDIPPRMPKEDGGDSEPIDQEKAQTPDIGLTENFFELIEKIHLRGKLEIGSQQMERGKGIPHEEVMQKIRERRELREKLLGDLAAPSGPVPDVKAVRPLEDFKLHIAFKDGTQRIFDMKPYRKGIFSDLQDPDYFSWVRVRWGGIRWPNGENLWPRVLYHNSDPV